MLQRRLWLRRSLNRLGVQIALQNRLDALVRTSLKGDGAMGSRFHSQPCILFGKPQDAEAGAVALFRVASAGDDAIKQLSSRRTDGFGPAHQTGRRPFEMALMGLGAMIIDRCGEMRYIAPSMARYAHAAVE